LESCGRLNDISLNRSRVSEVLTQMNPILPAQVNNPLIKYNFIIRHLVNRERSRTGPLIYRL